MRWKNKDQIRFTLRLPEDLYERLQNKLEKYDTMPISMNEYIIKALYRSIEERIPFSNIR